MDTFIDQFGPKEREVLELLPRDLLDLSDIQKARDRVQALAQLTAVEIAVDDIEINDHFIDTADSKTNFKIRLYRPKTISIPSPAILWIHGGGMVMGNVDADQSLCIETAKHLGVIIASVEYRLAPEYPYPAPLLDCFSALSWLHENSQRFEVDGSRIVVAGASAGGGLAAGTALYARDQSGPEIAGLLLVYPMLDDRNETKSSHAITDLRVWNRSANLSGWQAYLGKNSKAPEIYAAPARATDITKMPPTFISTGEFDLFHDENVAFAKLLNENGVDVELKRYPKTFHASNLFCPTSDISIEWNIDQLHAFSRLLKINADKN